MEVIGSLTKVVGDEVALSAEQVQRITEKVGGAVEQASMDSRKEKILSLLVEGELSTQDVYERMSISKVYVYRLLGDLRTEGKIVQRKEGRHAFWSLP